MVPIGDKSEIVYKTKSDVVLEDIRRDILSEVYKGGMKLPVEKELCEIYRTSRITVGRALASLKHEGLISRKTSAGTTVLERVKRKVALRLAGLMMVAQGHVFGELHSLLIQAIQKNHYFPVTINTSAEMDHVTIEKELEGHVKALVESSPDFFAIDGKREFPFEFLKNIADQINNLIFFHHFETELEFSASYVLSDYEHGGYIGTKHLLEIGCENILFCGNEYYEKSFSNSGQTLKGACRALAEHGKKYSSKMVFPWVRNYLSTVVARFRKPPRPDAVFAFSDAHARRIQRELVILGLEPGRDYMLLGYNNTPWTTEFFPLLSSISINETGMAKAFDKLIAKEDFRDRKTIMVEPKLIRRETT